MLIVLGLTFVMVRSIQAAHIYSMKKNLVLHHNIQNELSCRVNTQFPIANFVSNLVFSSRLFFFFSLCNVWHSKSELSAFLGRFENYIYDL